MAVMSGIEAARTKEAELLRDMQSRQAETAREAFDAKWREATDALSDRHADRTKLLENIQGRDADAFHKRWTDRPNGGEKDEARRNFAGKQAAERAREDAQQSAETKAFEDRRDAERCTLDARLADDKRAFEKTMLDRQAEWKLGDEKRGERKPGDTKQAGRGDHQQAATQQPQSQAQTVQGGYVATPGWRKEAGRGSVGMGRGHTIGQAWASAASAARDRDRAFANQMSDIANSKAAAEERGDQGAARLYEIEGKHVEKAHEADVWTDIANKEFQIRGESNEFKEYRENANTARAEAEQFAREHKEEQQRQALARASGAATIGGAVAAIADQQTPDQQDDKTADQLPEHDDANEDWLGAAQAPEREDGEDFDDANEDWLEAAEAPAKEQLAVASVNHDEEAVGLTDAQAVHLASLNFDTFAPDRSSQPERTAVGERGRLVSEQQAETAPVGKWEAAAARAGSLMSSQQAEAQDGGRWAGRSAQAAAAAAAAAEAASRRAQAATQRCHVDIATA